MRSLLESLWDWPDPVAMAVGALLVLPLAALLAGWLQWRNTRLAVRLEAKEVQGRRLAESLLSAPDGFYAWMGDGAELCSRRLAVLLGLGRGTDSTFADVLAVFADADTGRLAAAVEALHGDGEGFEVELALA